MFIVLMFLGRSLELFADINQTNTNQTNDKNDEVTVSFSKNTAVIASLGVCVGLEAVIIAYLLLSSNSVSKQFSSFKGELSSVSSATRTWLSKAVCVLDLMQYALKEPKQKEMANQIKGQIVQSPEYALLVTQNVDEV